GIGRIDRPKRAGIVRPGRASRIKPSLARWHIIRDAVHNPIHGVARLQQRGFEQCLVRGWKCRLSDGLWYCRSGACLVLLRWESRRRRIEVLHVYEAPERADLNGLKIVNRVASDDPVKKRRESLRHDHALAAAG